MHLFLLAVAGLGGSVSRDASDPDADQLDRSDTLDDVGLDPEDMPDSHDDDEDDDEEGHHGEEWSDHAHHPHELVRQHTVASSPSEQCSETDVPGHPHLKLVCDEFFAPVRDMFNAWSPERVANVVPWHKMAEGTGASGAQMAFIENSYIVKSVKAEEYSLLTFNEHALMRSYKEHMMKNPKSLLVRQFMMLKRIGVDENVPLAKAEYWLVINNWLPVKAQQVYDLKGSSSGREAKIEHRAKGDMKDNDWRSAKQAIRLTDTTKIWDQVVVDSKWLEKERLLDYSLIVGVTTVQGRQCRLAGQTVDADERTLPECEAPACAGDICVEAGLTSRGWSGPQETAWSRLGAAVCQQPGAVHSCVGDNCAETNGHTCAVTARRSGQAGEVAITSYCYGIIDMLTRWSKKKVAERAFKIASGQTDPSVRKPPKYARRFRKFLKSQFKGGYSSYVPTQRECCQIPQPGPRHCNGQPVPVKVDSPDYCLPAGGEECASTLKRPHSFTAPPSSRDWRTRAPGPRRPEVAQPEPVVAQPVNPCTPSTPAWTPCTQVQHRNVEPLTRRRPWHDDSASRRDASDAADSGKLVREETPAWNDDSASRRDAAVEPEQAVEEPQETVEVEPQQTVKKGAALLKVIDGVRVVYFLIAGAAVLIVAGVLLRMWMNRGPAGEASAPLVIDDGSPRRDARHSVAFAPEAHDVRGRQASVGFALQEDDVPARDLRRDTESSVAFNLLDETGRAADAPGSQRRDTDASVQFGFSVQETPHAGVERQGSVSFVVSDETARAADRRRQPSVGFGIREDRRDTDASCQFDFKDDD